MSHKITTPKAYHGGAFWDGIQSDFSTLERSKTIINADVLDAWFDPSPRVIEKLSHFLPWIIKTSPPTHCDGLVASISHHRGIPIDHILVGGGSSDLMFSFFPNILRKDEKILILDPMYGEYAHIFENVINAKLFRYKLDHLLDFEINFDELQSAIRSVSPNMVVIVNPNSPTGRFWASENILKLIVCHPEIVFVIDETYIEYIGKEYSLEKETMQHPNLVVIKSMSKVYALSGARVGYLVAHPTIINKVSAFIPPWSASLIAQVAAVEALNDDGYYTSKWAETHLLREEMIKQLQSDRTDIFSSTANFFLLRLKSTSADHIIKVMKSQNIFIRNCNSMSSQFEDNYLRITVKSKEDNKEVINALKQLL